MKKGFTLVELLAVIVILAIILAIAVPTISSLINNSKTNTIGSSAKMILNAIRLKELEDPSFDATTINETNLSTLNISNTDYKSVLVKKINGENYITLVGQNKFEGYTASGTKTDVSNYPTSTTTFINGANAPELVSGMTPIKWNGSAWVDTVSTDSSWYNYDTTNKLWANAKTADGSMWVWIPRYIYKIPTASWHTSTAGEIAIQFSKGINDNWNSAVIGNLTLTGTADASNNKWTTHPAFTFGSTEVTGIWVSKFEASNNGGKVASKPNATSWTAINVATMFNNSRSMETDTTYGWDNTGTNLDTHMMKNTEWGAAAYLSRSAYGKNGEIWINNINTDLTTGYGPSITGCAGSSASTAMLRSATCPVGNTYETATGINASASGNITGIYDMSGGAWEYVMGNLDNLPASSGLTMANVADKYINRYSSTNNYSYNNTTYGDAYYETSAGAYLNNSTGPTTAGWYSDYTYAPYSANPWFIRGGYYYSGAYAGAFYFHRYGGGAYTGTCFRPVIVIANNL